MTSCLCFDAVLLCVSFISGHGRDTVAQIKYIKTSGMIVIFFSDYSTSHTAVYHTTCCYSHCEFKKKIIMLLILQFFRQTHIRYIFFTVALIIFQRKQLSRRRMKIKYCITLPGRCALRTGKRDPAVRGL